MASGKVCTKCGETKPLDDFHRDKGRVDGRNPHCKECRREYKRRYREDNREKLQERERRYREENREKVLDRKRRYYEENRDKKIDYSRRYREENREKVLDRKRRYYEENRDIINQGNKMRHAQYRRTSSLLASKKGTPCSPEEDALLLANNGMTVYQKAVTLGRTYESCITRLRKLRSRQA